jgi:IS605 OrfB family transposase
MGVILALTSDQQKLLDHLMERYCAAVRWSFKRLLEEKKVQDIRKMVQAKFDFNSRQANDAVFEAQALISSQRELVQLNYTNAMNRVEHTKSRLAKARSPRKIANLTAKLKKQEGKLVKWKQYIQNNTFPTVIFGSKQMFYSRCKGLISKEEWQDARNNRYLSRGDKTKGGNLNTRIYTSGDTILLDIATTPIYKGKTIRYNRITMPIYLACKPSRKTGITNGRNYRQKVLDYLKTGEAYQVEIIRKNGKYHIHVTIEEETPVPYAVTTGAVGVDTNPTGLGVALTDTTGQFKGSRWFGQGEWTFARSNRRSNLTGEAAAQIVTLAKDRDSALVIEDLKFKHDKDISTKFNRISHNFVWSTFLQYLERGAMREGVPLIKVKPAFTSIIGILKYQAHYGISNHEAAGYCIARRGLGIKTEKVPQRLIDRFIQNQDEFYHQSRKQWATINKEVVKTLKKKEVKSLVSWQHHRKELLA